MGIRRSYGKKSNRPTDATPVERQDILRRVANVRNRFDSTRRGAGTGAAGRDGDAALSRDEPSALRPPDAPSET